MTTHPPARHDGLAPGRQVKIISGRYAGKTGVVDQVFRRTPDTLTKVMLTRVEGAPWIVVSVALAEIEIMREGGA